MASIAFDDLAEATAVLVAAKELAKILSGIAAVQFGSPEPLTVGVVVRTDEEGKRHPTFIAAGTISILPGFSTSATGTVTNPDGTVQEDSSVMKPLSPIARAMASSLRSEARAKAYRLRSDPKTDWSVLYKILEVIETEVPMDEIIQRGWATRIQLRLFKHTANSIKAAGDLSRHGKESTRQKPPANPMSLEEGRGLIDRLLGSWNN